MENTSGNIIVNGVAIPKKDILNLIQSGRKLEAVKYIVEAAKIGLKEAKDQVDFLEAGITGVVPKTGKTSYSVNLTKENGKVILTYKNGDTEKQNIIPGDAEWMMVKKLMKDNAMFQEYEKQVGVGVTQKFDLNQYSNHTEKRAIPVKTIFMSMLIGAGLLYLILKWLNKI